MTYWVSVFNNYSNEVTFNGCSREELCQLLRMVIRQEGNTGVEVGSELGVCRIYRLGALMDLMEAMKDVGARMEAEGVSEGERDPGADGGEEAARPAGEPGEPGDAEDTGAPLRRTARLNMAYLVAHPKMLRRWQHAVELETGERPESSAEVRQALMAALEAEKTIEVKPVWETVDPEEAWE